MQYIKPTNDAGREMLLEIENRLLALRTNLESVTLKPEETQVIRGRIAELKRIKDSINGGNNG